jgi:hypothetical protein
MLYQLAEPFTFYLHYQLEDTNLNLRACLPGTMRFSLLDNSNRRDAATAWRSQSGRARYVSLYGYLFNLFVVGRIKLLLMCILQPS